MVLLKRLLSHRSFVFALTLHFVFLILISIHWSSPKKVIKPRSMHVQTVKLAPKTIQTTKSTSTTTASTTTSTPKKEVKKEPKKETKTDSKTTTPKQTPTQKTPAKKSTASKPVPAKTTTTKANKSSACDDLLASIEKDMAQIGKKTTPAATTATSKSSYTTLKWETDQLMNPKEMSYLDEVVGALQQSLILPEYGSVKIELTINKNGSVANLKVVSSESSKNKKYIEENLTTFLFSPNTTSQSTFSVILCNQN
ncbi:MAG: hypothetical protein JHC93_00695 [Parachlamydiales bacterium]|nr:hypothetical protein [Parachlamydiales bacterium]